MKRLITIICVAVVAVGLSGCDRRIAFVSDSMGFYDPAVIESQLEADGDTVVRYHTSPGTTAWNNPYLSAELFASDVDTIVVTFGLNEVRYLRGDWNAQPQYTLPQVYSSWNTVKQQAAANGKCLVWVNMQTAAPLNPGVTGYYIQQLNAWSAANVRVANWRDPVNNNIWFQGATWVKQDDGFHLRQGSWGPAAYGIVAREAVQGC